MVKHQVGKLIEGADLLTKKPTLVIAQLKKDAKGKGLSKRKIAHLGATFRRKNAKARRLANRKLRSRAALAAMQPQKAA